MMTPVISSDYIYLLFIRFGKKIKDHWKKHLQVHRCKYQVKPKTWFYF